MRLYRDLAAGETVQVGDLWRLVGDVDAMWPAITDDDIAEAPEGGRIVTSVEESGIEYRRPVDLPVLQPVTPEAMAELEQSEWVGIIHTCEYYTAVKGWDGKQWYDEATGNNVDRPTGGWFIELEKLKEVQQ